MNAATAAAINKALKDKYESEVVSLVVDNQPLASELKRNTDKAISGRQAVVAVEVSPNMSGDTYDEMGALPDADYGEHDNITIDFVNLASAGAISGQAVARTKDKVGAFVDELQYQIDQVVKSQDRLWARQVWGRPAGDLARIATGGVAGTGTAADPFVLTLEDDRAIVAKFFRSKLKLASATLGTNASGQTTATKKPGTFRIVHVDRASKTIKAVIDSGTPVPAAGDYLVAANSNNNNMNGLAEALVESDAVFQGLSRLDRSEWAPVVSDAAGAVPSIDLLTQFENEIEYESGERPNLRLTTAGIERKLSNELKNQYRYTGSPDDLKVGEGFTFRGVKTKVDYSTPSGEVVSLNTRYVETYAAEEGHWLTQGGDNLLRLARGDYQEFIFVDYVNLGWKKRSAHGRLTGLDDPTTF